MSKPFRIVIQQLAVRPVRRYRLIVYGDDDRPEHRDIDTEQGLLKILREASPDLDLSQFSLDPLEQGRGSIVFADEMHLSEEQLVVLGF